MRVLVLCDDYWHPASTVRDGLAPLASEGFAFDIIADAREWSAEKMAGYPAVLFAKSNEISQADQTGWVTPEVEQAFLDYVKAGGGLLVVHSGSASYAEKPVLRALIGGVFLRHPPQLPVTSEPKAGHPVTAGVGAFTVKDEHYFTAFDATDAEVLGTTTSDEGTDLLGWTRTEGRGRVCMLTPGHNLEVWLDPEYQKLLANALRWVAGTLS